jgi:hypothetical protein
MTPQRPKVSTEVHIMKKQKILRRPYPQEVWDMLLEQQKDVMPAEYLSSGPGVSDTIQCTHSPAHSDKG